jgi:hypothetical protein
LPGAARAAQGCDAAAYVSYDTLLLMTHHHCSVARVDPERADEIFRVNVSASETDSDSSDSGRAHELVKVSSCVYLVC